MKNSTRLVLIVFFSLVILISFSFKSYKTSNSHFYVNVDSTANFLAKYGEYVFQRESCLNCHSLNQSNDVGLISLDGMKDKYVAKWHFSHLTNPSSTVYDSKMPSYNYLNELALDEEAFKKLVPENQNLNWNVLINQANSMYEVIKGREFEVKNKTEILALIAYLQSIPASKDLISKDSIQNLELVNKQKEWDVVILDLDNFINKEITTKGSIEKGKEIFEESCVNCHKTNGAGLIGPNLTDDYWIHGGSIGNIGKSIIYGIPEKGMIGWRELFSPKEVGQLVAYIRSIKNSNPEDAKMPQGKKE